MLYTRLLIRFTSSRASSIYPSHLISFPTLAFTFLVTFFSLILVSPHTFAAQINLAWDANTESDLAGYMIHYGTASNTYETSIDVGNVTTYPLTVPAPGTYFIAATAYNTSDIESGYSNEVIGVAFNGTPITVATSPPELRIVVDGTTNTAPQTFDWTEDSSHTLSVSSPQPGSSGVLFTFSSWSDGKPATHTITVTSSPATYTANFITQYSLTTLASPPEGGSVDPSGTNWFDSGYSVSLFASPGGGYLFSEWTGDLTGSTNPTSVIMNGPKNVTVNFVCSYSITPTSTSLGSAASTGSVTVTAGSGCNWTAVTKDPWITVASGGSGRGNGSVNYSVSANNGTRTRTGRITIAGQTFAVTQAGKKN